MVKMVVGCVETERAVVAGMEGGKSGADQFRPASGNKTQSHLAI